MIIELAYSIIAQGTETSTSVIPESTSTSLMDMSILVVTTALPSHISSVMMFSEALQLCLLSSQQQLMAAVEVRGSVRKQALAICMSHALS
jgi:hypothetical protein